MGDLSDWGRKGNKFLTCKNGETLVGKFEGAKVVPCNFKPEDETIAYIIDGKTFNSGSRKLAIQMDDVPLGSTVSIARQGDGAKTTYTVTVLA